MAQGFGFLENKFDSNDVKNPLLLDAGTKVFFLIINGDNGEILLKAFSQIHVDGNTEYEVRIAIVPPIRTNLNILRPPPPPPSPPPSPETEFLLRL